MGRLTRRINAEIAKGLTYEAIIYKDIEHHETDFNYKALEKLAHYEDMEEQGRLIDRNELIMSIADWQMTLTPANNEADVYEYNILESVIEHIADFDEAEVKNE